LSVGERRALIKKVLIRVCGVSMLRRYLITNAVSTAVLYVAVSACASSLSSLSKSITTTANSFVMSDTFLAPVLNGMITVSAGLYGGE
jgi:hypothetical protein